MKYLSLLQQRTNTFSKTYELILENIIPKKKYVIVELGTSRSFKSWGISSDLKDWFPDDPKRWAWSDGCFTRLFLDNLEDYDIVMYTIDPCPNAVSVVKTMTQNNKNIVIIKTTSTEFLKNFSDKIDFLYMDHLESGEKACNVHLEDARLLIEKDLMNDNALILIDDTPKLDMESTKSRYFSKGQYSIPYLLDNGYETVIHEYQMLLKKK